MADLQQIIGAILRDLAKARFASDLYSRSIARYYEGDNLLRKFPVPRADIAEVEIDLKFSITEVRESEVNAESREANVAILLERSVERLVATYLDLARDFTANSAHREVAERLEKLLSKGFNSMVLRIELRQLALRYFIESYTHLIANDGTFDAAAALRGLRQPFFWAHANYRQEGVSNADLEGPLNAVFDDVFANKEFKAVIDSLAEPIKTIWQANYDARLEVEVDGHKLAQLQAAAISSIRIKAEVRNSVWTEVKVGEHQYQRSLTPE